MEVQRSVLVVHSAVQMFDLIEAAEHYPAFLPWCAGATIVARDQTIVVADIVVDYHGVRFKFTTRNPKRAPEWMAITLDRGPFRRFEGEWNLKALGQEGCRVDFTLRYDFESGVMRTLAGPVFERITNALVDAFVARADTVYASAPASPDAEPPVAGGGAPLQPFSAVPPADIAAAPVAPAGAGGVPAPPPGSSDVSPPSATRSDHE